VAGSQAAWLRFANPGCGNFAPEAASISATVISSLQITSDGLQKRSLVTDGTRLYFSE